MKFFFVIVSHVTVERLYLMLTKTPVGSSAPLMEPVIYNTNIRPSHSIHLDDSRVERPFREFRPDVLSL